jgi:transcriptional regulator with PAS, ATPase and Fis domain
MLKQTRPLIGWSDAMERLRSEIQRTAPTNMTVMIRGERGTGKELVAREIHLKSTRSDGPFVGVNCAVLPENLVDTELFGCEKGAFTGAEFRKGRFEQANNGTLFLDEVGELSLMAQAKLLRVLETREVDRIGGQRPVPVNLRIIAATNRNLEQMSRSQKFRDDLYDRLNMDYIRTPALRDRMADIPALVNYFVDQYRAEANRQVTGASEAVLSLFATHSWPGNIRELENVTRRAVLAGRTDRIEVDDLPMDFPQDNCDAALTHGTFQQQMHEHSRRVVEAALQQAAGHRINAAKRLGISRAQIYRLLRLHGLGGEAKEPPQPGESWW